MSMLIPSFPVDCSLILMVEVVFRATSQNSSPDLHFLLQRSLYEGRDTACFGNTGAGGNPGFGSRKFTDLAFAPVTLTSF